MDIRELKQLLKNSASVLILDEGEPAFVILDYRVYRQLTGEQSRQDAARFSDAPAANGAVESTPVAPIAQPSLSPQELEAIERLNKEIQALKEQIEAEQGSDVF